jgi:cation/acetate symporter
LLAISSAVSHDLIKGQPESEYLGEGRTAVGADRHGGGHRGGDLSGLNPPGFAAQTVALAFGLAAASIFPALMMGIFTKVNNRGAVAGCSQV